MSDLVGVGGSEGFSGGLAVGIGSMYADSFSLQSRIEECSVMGGKAVQVRHSMLCSYVPTSGNGHVEPSKVQRALTTVKDKGEECSALVILLSKPMVLKSLPYLPSYSTASLIRHGFS